MARPLGVTIICILGFLGAILGILGGLGLLALGGLIAAGSIPTSIPVAGLLTGMMGTVLGLVMLILSIVSFVALYWLWKMKKLGWKVVMLLEIISLVLSLVQFNYIGLIIPAIIVIYLWMKKDLFK